MKLRPWFLVMLAALAILAGAIRFSRPPMATNAAIDMPAAAGFRILFGLTDKQPAQWNGKISLSGGRITDIKGWRFSGSDTTDHQSSWRAQTRKASQGNQILEAGIVVSAVLDDSAAQFTVDLERGSFSFKASDIAWDAGTTFLKGQARVDRTLAPVQLTTSPEEQDFPAATQTADEVLVAYVEFVHGDRSQDVRPFKEAPESLDFLARPAGGDQVFLLRYSKARRQWSDPVAVSQKGQDIMRAAVAVDGQNRVWVFWSANQDDNFDIYARVLTGSTWSNIRRVTSDPGPDLNPVAATASDGRVWAAWQGYRNGNLEVLAAAQNGDQLTPETIVSQSAGSDWDPVIAASPKNGEVAIAWDTYDKGDYDVYFRRMRFERDIVMDAPVAVAATENFEARPSIAYDPQNRLWAAYEASDTKWGKDFGAYETTGIALYQGHTLKVTCFQGNDAFVTAGNLNAVLPVLPSAGSYGQGARGDPKPSVFQPNPAIAENRKPNGGAAAPQLPHNSFPRIAADPQGTVFLAFRSSTGVRASVGTAWVEMLAWFNGTKWTGPAEIANTDGLLDSRPALVPLANGRLVVVSACDHRQSPVKFPASVQGDPVNTDLYAAEMQVNANQQQLKLNAVPASVPPPPSDETIAERGQIQAMRDYRVTIGDQELRLMRGEFHRHTEISSDGANDGPLIDAYRYLIDSASMDWGGCCDHDNGGGREYYWWLQQKLTDAYHLPGRYTPMFAYERSVAYPEGHRNVVFPTRGVRPLPRLPKMADDSPPAPAPDTQLLYRYLRQFAGICASHTSGTDMGTDWRDNDPVLEPAVEIYQGDRQNYEMPDAPRTNSADDSIGGWRELGFVALALQKGYRLGFQASSDHISTHMSYCNLWVTEPGRDAIMEAFHKRRIYGATDNILADVRCGPHFMGEEFTQSDPPVISVVLKGTANFGRVHIIKDGQYVYTAEPGVPEVAFTWRDSAAAPGKTSYYYVRGEQENGELVWVSPMWITVK